MTLIKIVFVLLLTVPVALFARIVYDRWLGSVKELNNSKKKSHNTSSYMSQNVEMSHYSHGNTSQSAAPYSAPYPEHYTTPDMDERYRR